ncbi:Protein of unknown function [Gryllus bimaculatus]|nr:Protein of unknown function [Gryllus bimaculatus]
MTQAIFGGGSNYGGGGGDHGGGGHGGGGGGGVGYSGGFSHTPGRSPGKGYSTDGFEGFGPLDNSYTDDFAAVHSGGGLFDGFKDDWSDGDFEGLGSDKKESVAGDGQGSSSRRRRPGTSRHRMRPNRSRTRKGEGDQNNDEVTQEETRNTENTNSDRVVAHRHGLENTNVEPPVEKDEKQGDLPDASVLFGLTERYYARAH